MNKPLLSRSIDIRGLHVSNRLVMPPMATEKSGDGSVTGALCEYYDEKSKGGHIGLIITEHAFVAPEGKASKGQLSVAEDCDVLGLLRLTDTIHKNGSAVFAQINHAGGVANPEVTGCENIGPSAVKISRRHDYTPREMSKADIARVTEAFAMAARRAKAGGYDGVEIHSAHGYLLNQFFSPLANKRTDEYGCDCIESRVRFHLEVIQAVREVVGDDYPIAIRLGACDYTDGGSTIEDAVAACRLFEEAGVDLLDISGGLCGYTHPTDSSEGWFREITAPIKRAVSVPVILTGGVVTGDGAEQLLAEDAADMIGVGRAILKDSGWAAREMA